MSGHLTDLEITRLCAETRGIKLDKDYSTPYCLGLVCSNGDCYDPLHDDAQAMALGKSNPALFFSAVQEWAFECVVGREADLNRIVCIAFAKMQQAKTCPAT